MVRYKSCKQFLFFLQNLIIEKQGQLQAVRADTIMSYPTQPVQELVLWFFLAGARWAASSLYWSRTACSNTTRSARWWREISGWFSDLWQSWKIKQKLKYFENIPFLYHLLFRSTKVQSARGILKNLTTSLLFLPHLFVFFKLISCL